MNMNDEYNLNRFIEAQEDDYEIALSEVRNGRKEKHWMWYIFPQITGLGMSPIAKYFEIKSLEEARAYLNDEILGAHLLEITNALLKLETDDPIEVFGGVDALKLKSSMTLFDYVSNDEIFYRVLDKYYHGEKDLKTIGICDGLKGVTLGVKPNRL